MDSVAEIVREMEDNFLSGTTQMSTYVSANLKEDIDKIEAYMESKHTSGETDSQGREKPFFNIVLAAVNIWFRATDIDRKNININATKEEDTILAFLATIHLQNFMRKSNFGLFLNKWGYTLATYLSSVIKFVEKGGELIPEVVPWTRLICDMVDFDSNPKIEKLSFTPAQLKENKNYDQEQVKFLLDALTTRKNIDRQQKDMKSGYVEVYEIHGELPLSFLTGREEDKDIYQQQMHVISFVKGKEGKFDDYTLYSGREKDPYILTSLFPTVDGSVSLNGAVKRLFTAQWMVNHTAKTIKDQLDLASKIITQTSDTNFVGRNVLSAIEQGDILIHKPNEPLTRVNTQPDIVALQSSRNDWQNLGNQIDGLSESMLGINPPSGTAWRLEQAKLMEAHSLFEVMTENKGLFIEEMLRKFIIPFLKKKMDTKDEIMTTLKSHQIKWVDSRYVPNKAIKIRNENIKKAVLGGEIPNPPEQISLEQDIQKNLNSYGNQRPFRPSDISDKTWKDIFKDFNWDDVEVDITGEQKDKQAMFDTLNTALQVVVNPNYATNPDAKMIVGKILEQTSMLSPIELGYLNSVNPVAPVAGGVGTGKEVAMK